MQNKSPQDQDAYTAGPQTRVNVKEYGTLPW